MAQMKGGRSVSWADDYGKRSKELQDPMAQMEQELDRIDRFLAHDAVRPDISGWQSQSQAQQRPQQQTYRPTYQQQAYQQRSTTPVRAQQGSPSRAAPAVSPYAARSTGSSSP